MMPRLALPLSAVGNRSSRNTQDEYPGQDSKLHRPPSWPPLSTLPPSCLAPPPSTMESTSYPQEPTLYPAFSDPQYSPSYSSGIAFVLAARSLCPLLYPACPQRSLRGEVLMRPQRTVRTVLGLFHTRSYQLSVIVLTSLPRPAIMPHDVAISLRSVPHLSLAFGHIHPQAQQNEQMHKIALASPSE